MKRHLLPQIKCFFLLALLLTVAVGAKAEGINVTSADIGKVLRTDGSIYNDEWEPTRYGKTPVAMIAYVDTENGKGLAIALKNAKDEGTWNDAQTDIANWISSKG